MVTHSSGNHGAALAWAAPRRGIPAWIVMPDNAPKIKQANVAASARSAFLRAERCRPRGDVRGGRSARPARRWCILTTTAGDRGAGHRGARAARSTCPTSTPWSRRSAAAGCCRARRSPREGMRPDIRVYGAEPAGADDAARSFASGRVEPHGQSADHRRRPAHHARRRVRFAAMRAHLDGIATCSEGGDRRGDAPGRGSG